MSQYWFWVFYSWASMPLSCTLCNLFVSSIWRKVVCLKTLILWWISEELLILACSASLFHVQKRWIPSFLYAMPDCKESDRTERLNWTELMPDWSQKSIFSYSNIIFSLKYWSFSTNITICNDQLHGFINLLSVSSSWMLVFPSGLDSKESACNAGHLGLTPGLGRSLEEGMAIHSSILAWGIPKDRGSWWATIHRVTKKSDTTEWLSTAQAQLGY